MYIECPKCKEEQEVCYADLTDKTSDDSWFDCQNPKCEHTFKIGWYAEIEVRDDMLNKTESK
jgi:hypothetical protein